MAEGATTKRPGPKGRPKAGKKTGKKIEKETGRPVQGAEKNKRATKAQKAAAAGKPTGAGAQIKRSLKNLTIYEEWRSGVESADLAKTHGVSERRIRQVIDELRASSIEAFSLDHRLSRLRFAEDLLLRRSTAVSEAARLIRTAEKANNLNVVLGAMKRRDEALSALTELMQARGWLPRSLANLQVEADAVELVEAMFEVFQRFGVPDEVGEAIAEVVELRARRVGGRLMLDAGLGSVDADVVATVEEVPA